MEVIGAVLLVLAVLLFVVVFIAQPFIKKGAQVGKDEKELDHQRSTLLAERDRVVTALQELDFDQAMGKVPEDEYPYQRAVLLKSGASVLRRLDALEASAGGTTVAGAAPLSPEGIDPVEERIEAAARARRADTAASQVSPAPMVSVGTNGGKSKDEMEELIASRKRERKESAAGFCPRCGKPVQKSDKFCARCGATL